MKPASERSTSPRGISLVERLTALVLMAVVAALGWVTVAAFIPQSVDVAAEPWQVVALLALLFAALGLVSLVALLHTRR